MKGSNKKSKIRLAISYFWEMISCENFRGRRGGGGKMRSGGEKKNM